MIPFIKYKNIFLGLTVISVIACIAAIAAYGLKLSIEFTGGSIIELQYKNTQPASSAIIEATKDLGLAEITVYSSGDNSVSLRTESLTPETHAKLLEALKKTGDFEEKSFEAIGPVIGSELKGKTQLLIIISLAAMLIYIAIAFKNVPGPVSSWKYGAASFVILVHDVLVPLGVFSVLGKGAGVQITIPVVTALLIVVGYAINNVIVVYDRIRENLTRDRKADFSVIADRAINQTLSRQINTSVATLLPVFAIYFWGGITLKYFALALILGIATGTYSSVFLASQILVAWMSWNRRK